MLRDRLYGEEAEKTEDFRFHCETLFSRSSLYRFEIDVHQHPGFFQILYISDGNGDASLDGVTQIIQPPAAILVPPGFKHGFLFSRDIAGIILTLLPGAMSPSVQAVLRRNFHRPSLLMLKNSLERAEVETSFERIAQEYATHEVGRDAMIEGHIAMIITLLARADRPKLDANSKNLEDRRFGLLQSLITRHLREPQDAQFYAGKLGVSQTHLNRLVRSACGLSLQRLIARRQIEEAKQELLFTFSTVQNISDRLGFTEPGYFCRFFKRETGMTPRQWRMAERKRYAAF